MLKPQDIAVALKLLTQSAPFGYERLASDLHIGVGSAHRSVARLKEARLISQHPIVNRQGMLEFILHGIKYAFYVTPGAETRGMPTAYAAPPLTSVMALPSRIPVWPDPKGKVRGFAVEPLYEQAPEAARRDPKLYELLALVDAIRIGSAREYQLAKEELEKRLK
jgi:hypothetical protein